MACIETQMTIKTTKNAHMICADHPITRYDLSLAFFASSGLSFLGSVLPDSRSFALDFSLDSFGFGFSLGFGFGFGFGLGFGFGFGFGGGRGAGGI